MAETDEIEVLEQVPEFRGLPHEVIVDAQAQARAELASYWPALVNLGQGVAEQTLVRATAHYLATTGTPLAQPDSQPSPRRGALIGAPGELGAWAGSPYGDAVARILRPLVARAGTRRCGGIAEMPTGP